MMYLNSLS